MTEKCEDCRQDPDRCCDCCDGDLYRSPDIADWREEYPPPDIDVNREAYLADTYHTAHQNYIKHGETER